MQKKIIIGSDHGGFNLKQKIIEHLKSNGYEIDNVGCFSEESCDYPVIAKQAYTFKYGHYDCLDLVAGLIEGV